MNETDLALEAGEEADERVTASVQHALRLVGPADGGAEIRGDA